jgi:hypothetical protein
MTNTERSARKYNFRAGLRLAGVYTQKRTVTYCNKEA